MRNIIEELEQRITTNCKHIDVEQRFRDMLDECYSFDSIGGPFAGMSPSRVLEEVDPTAFRCGVADYSDGEDWAEIDGEYYETDDCEDQKDSLIDELETEQKEDTDDAEDIQELIDELQAHVF
jgi:hypothetical protein